MLQYKTLLISESIGSVSVVEEIPVNCFAILLLAHGAGAGMEHPFMQQLAWDLGKHNIGTIRYNFPYMEKGKGRPDPTAVAEKTVEVLGAWVAKKYSQVPIFAGGKSFGGRMTSQYFSKNGREYLNGLIFFGFPLHAIGKESVLRADHLKRIQVPMLFLQGTKDKLANQELISGVCDALPRATLNLYEGVDHAFKVSKKYTTPDLAAAASEWIRKILRT